MEPTQLLIAALVAILVIYILFKVAQKILKVVLLVVVLGLAFYFWQGGTVKGLSDSGVETLFNKSTISNMMDKNCPDDKASSAKCLCVIQPVHEDLTARYSQSEIREIDSDQERLRKEISQSLKRQQKSIRSCLVKNKGPEYLDGLKKIWGGIKESVEHTSQ